jgi:hypothetical protein
MLYMIMSDSSCCLKGPSDGQRAEWDVQEHPRLPQAGVGPAEDKRPRRDQLVDLIPMILPSSCVPQVVQTEGVMALTIGLAPTIIRNSIWNSIYYVSCSVGMYVWMGCTYGYVMEVTFTKCGLYLSGLPT